MKTKTTQTVINNLKEKIAERKLQLTDFMNVGEAGFVEGISNIIVKKLNDLDETIRPIHCTDQKRETFYVKDEDKWENENENDPFNIWNIKNNVKDI